MCSIGSERPKVELYGKCQENTETNSSLNLGKYLWQTDQYTKQYCQIMLRSCYNNSPRKSRSYNEQIWTCWKPFWCHTKVSQKSRKKCRSTTKWVSYNFTPQLTNTLSFVHLKVIICKNVMTVAWFYVRQVKFNRFLDPNEHLNSIDHEIFSN